jgi:K+-sensing histidine kinase KdpD
MRFDPVWLFVSGWISGWARYTVAVAGVLATVALTVLSPPLIAHKTFIAPFLAIAVLSARLCGFGPSAVVTVIGALATAWFLPPSESLEIATSQDLMLLAAFVAVCGFGTVLTAKRSPLRLS